MWSLILILHKKFKSQVAINSVLYLISILLPFQVDDDYDDDDVGVDELRHHPLSYPAPIPWPPAIVSPQNQQQQNDQSGSGKKKKKPGIVYLSSIPTGYNVTRTITFFSQFGKVGRVFLQPGKVF